MSTCNAARALTVLVEKPKAWPKRSPRRNCIYLKMRDGVEATDSVKVGSAVERIGRGRLKSHDGFKLHLRKIQGAE
jgi:hypothetical protein